MAIAQEGSLPAFFVLSAGMVVRMTAIDPVTGAVVAGVVVSNASIDVDEESTSVALPPPSPVTGAYTTGGLV